MMRLSSTFAAWISFTVGLFHRVIADTPPVVHFEVNEESPLHTTIGNISAFILPQPTITTDSVFFHVTPKGVVQLSTRLDLEALCSEKLLCCERDKPCELSSSVVIESGRSRDMQTLELRVHVLDINDNAPTFLTGDSGQIIEIHELARVGSLFDLMPAIDRDIARGNQIQRYALQGAELKRMFELDTSDMAAIRLRLLRPLDYEQETRYAGVLEACDPHNCVRQNVTIKVTDANDNRPVFLKTSYNVTVPENFSVGQTVLQLDAEDKDSPVNARMEFRFHGETDQGLLKTFRLERDSGRIISRNNLAAHRRSEYRFEVSVSEASPESGQVLPEAGIGSPSPNLLPSSASLASVIIRVEDLNDFSPIIKMFSPSEGQPLSVLENMPPTRVCVVQVSDSDSGDNGRVTCRLTSHSSASPGTFTLTNSGKLYTISTTRPFDAEREPQLTVTLTCTDFGVPSRSSSRELLIKVEDANEHAPELERNSYHTNVRENAVAGTELVRVVARDRDLRAQLYYELSAQGKQYFTINSTNGAITTIGNAGVNLDITLQPTPSTLLDREKVERIAFVVCVSDGPPRSACDADTGLATAVDNTAPQVYTASATVSVTVLDVNDNRPHFIEKGPFSVPENQPRFTQLNGQLAAIDQDDGDNSRVRYSLRQVWISASGMPAPDLFQVDADGHIQTLELLDRETVNAYILELVACDSAPQTPLCASFNATVSVLDENDNKPEWRYPHDEDKEVNITADLPPGHIIARVHAGDRDTGANGRILYSLIDPHKRTVFQVDNKTGDVAVAEDPTHNQGPLDLGAVVTPRLHRPSPLLPGIYRLRLRASDQGHPPQMTETWLQVNVFSSDAVGSAGLNFMIIVVMVAVTGLVSICLVVAIICVRRRSFSTRPCFNLTDRDDATGLRRGRDAGDGAEVHFPFKHEYGFPVDGASYLMGISPTPSDLDALKFSYQQTASIPFLGAVNGGADTGHLFAWSGLNASNSVCYPVGVPMNFIGEHAVTAATLNSHPTTTLRLPTYGSYSRYSPSTVGSDQATLRLMPQAHCPDIAVPTSSACLTFISNSPVLDQNVPNSAALQNFVEADSNVGKHDRREDMNIPCCVDSGNDHYHQHQYPSGNRGSYDGEIAFRHSVTPLYTGTNPNVLGYCSGAGRRLCGMAHCELDVESADSGRGASEDDPAVMNGTGVVQFYPTFQIAHSSNAHSNGCASVNYTGLIGVADSASVGSCNGCPIQLNLRIDDASTSVPEHKAEWNLAERRPRLKC
ncbi:unnamed protein product [Dicrocoelium dendriticum]|nr:unnamed protein product [Dicrocoelium dendriticum]